jgi:hypothetical protein
MQILGKFEVAHIVAMVLHVVILKEAIEEQGREMSRIFNAFDSKTQVLIDVPIASSNAAQSSVQSIQFSTALVCRDKANLWTRSFVDQQESSDDSI